MKKILLGIIGVGIGLFSSFTYANDDVTGTWVKPCSYDPIPGEKKPNYSTITATLEQHHIHIEFNYFVDSACRSPWKLMPTFLQTGTYRLQSKSITKRLKGKNVSVRPVKIHITHYDNHAKFKRASNFTVYFNHYFKIYIQKGKRLQVFKKAITEPKARVAKEVYKQENNIEVCILSMKMPRKTFSWCLENVSFPKQKFRAYCEASKPEERGGLHYAYSCPAELKSSSCLYGLQELGHNLRRWYTKEEVKLNPKAKQACEKQLRGTWNK